MKYAIGHGILDMSYVQDVYEMNKRQEMLKEHPYKIWKGKCGKWYTYLPDKEKGRKLIMEQVGHTDISCTEIHYHRNRRDVAEKKEILSAVPDFSVNQKGNQFHPEQMF